MIKIFSRTALLMTLLVGFFTPMSFAQEEALINRIENGLMNIELGAQGPVQSLNITNINNRLQHYNAPGAAIAVVNNYEFAWSKAFGKLNENANLTATTKSVYQAGSISKAITAAMVLHFVDTGLINLDTPVNKYLDSWQIPSNEFTKNKPVTLRLILSHQSGLPATNFSYDRDIGLPTLIQILNGAPPALNAPAVVGFAPGSRYQYSNMGYVVVQKLLEDVAGDSFEQIAQEVIFQPLGMTNSTFKHPLPEQLRFREALPHGKTGETLEAVQTSPARAQGGLMTTAEDMAKFLAEIMKASTGRSEFVFSQKTSEHHFDRLTHVGSQDFGGVPFGVALGVYLLDEGEDFSIMHLGSSYPGSEAIFIGFPNRGQGAVIMINADTGTLLLLEILASLVNEYNWPSGDYLNPRN